MYIYNDVSSIRFKYRSLKKHTSRKDIVCSCSDLFNGPIKSLLSVFFLWFFHTIKNTVSIHNLRCIQLQVQVNVWNIIVMQTHHIDFKHKLSDLWTVCYRETCIWYKIFCTDWYSYNGYWLLFILTLSIRAYPRHLRYTHCSDTSQ